MALQRSTNSGSTYTNQAVQGTYVSNYQGLCQTYPVIAVSAGDYWKLSPLPNLGTVTFIVTCGLAGGGQSGTIPCSYVNFTRIA